MSILDPESDVVAETFSAQEKFIDAVLSGDYRYLLFGGSIRAGKTVTIFLALITLAKAFPRSRWIVVMHDRPTMVRTVLPTFFKVCPDNFLANFNNTNLIATFTNDSTLEFMSEQIEHDPDLNRFKSLEANGFAFPQLEGIMEETFDMCIQRSGQWQIVPMPPQLLIGDCNPTHNWVKERFYKPWKNGTLKPGYYFQPADINDNPYITDEYKASLKDLPEVIYRRFVKGSWEAADELNQLVPWAAIYQCERKLDTTDNAYYLGVDVGHLGSDKSVFTLMQGENIVEQTEFSKKNTVEVAQKVKHYMASYKIPENNIVVDVVGVGAGVYDQLQADGFYHIIAMKGGSREFVDERLQGTEFRFAHWKAWSYWVAAEELKAGRIGGVTHETMKTEAAAIWYFIKNNVIWTEGKDDLRKRIGHSCDFWDSFVYAVWARMQHKLIARPGIYTSSQYAKEKANAK